MAASTKARIFNGTSSDYLQSASTIDLSATAIISVAFWLWWDTFANDNLIAFETSASYSVNSGAFIILPNASTGNFGFWCNSAGTSREWHITRPSAGAWHHYVFVYDITSNPSVAHAYVDGAADSAVVDTAAGAGGFFGNYTLNVMSRNAASLFGAGRLSDIAIYTSALSQGNAATLYGCGDPGALGPAFWWPIKHVSPETPDAGGINLTVTGTTTTISNCAGAPAATLMGQILT